MNTIIKLIKKLLRKTRAKKVPSNLMHHVVPRSQHHVSKTDISPNALKVLNRLTSAGYQAFLVGGSVRDLLLRKVPKDFDVSTSATPQQVKALFRNARIIGRRFKLVHILYHREIIEVATFRGNDHIDENHQTNAKGMVIRDNVYGTLEEDAWRRDFTINSLYYNIEDASIVDFTGGVKDIHEHLIRIIGDPEIRYREDPVRMIRAVRFSAKLQFAIEEKTAAPLSQLSELINHVSGSRLFDEVTKLFQCGEAKSVLQLLIKYGFFKLLFSQTAALFDSNYPVNELIVLALENTDTRILENKPITPAFIFAVLLWHPMLACSEQLKQEGLEPLPALEKAMSQIISEQNRVVTIPKRFTQVMREIWLLQFRFAKRSGHRAFGLLEHPRFRAAYDFLALRALAGDEAMELAQWWTTFQDTEPNEQIEMVNALTEAQPIRKPRRKRKRQN